MVTCIVASRNGLSYSISDSRPRIQLAGPMCHINTQDHYQGQIDAS